MKIKNDKIVEATESELLKVYFNNGIDDIMDFNEYKQRMENAGCVIVNQEKPVQDVLYISVDFSTNDTDMMMVMRRKGDETHIINLLKNEEAREVYNKLIGKGK